MSTPKDCKPRGFPRDCNDYVFIPNACSPNAFSPNLHLSQPGHIKYTYPDQYMYAIVPLNISEIRYQRWYRDKKKCQFKVLNVLKVSKCEKLKANFHCFHDECSIFQNFENEIWGQCKIGGKVPYFRTKKN